MLKKYKHSIFLFIGSALIFSSCAGLQKRSADFYFLRAEKKFKESKYLDAISDLKKAKEKDLEKKLPPQSLLLTGEAYFQQSILYRHGILLFDKDTKATYINYLKTAQEYFNKIILEYPKSDSADDAQFNIGLIYDWDELGGLNDFDQALIEYQKVIDNYPGSSAYPKAKSKVEMLYSIYGGLKSAPRDIKKP